MLPTLSYINGLISIAFLYDAYMSEAASARFFAAVSTAALGKTNNSTHRESMRFSITSGAQIHGKELSNLLEVTDMRKWHGFWVSN